MENYITDIYADLKTISGIHCTDREIDITACILAGKSSKKIASILSIAPKTVENHIQNILEKFACNSRDSIIELVENSGQFSLIRQHYLHLLIQNSFENELVRISEHVKPIQGIRCLAFHHKNEITKESLAQQLIKYLKSLGLECQTEIWRKHHSKDNFIKNGWGQKFQYILYVLSSDFLNELKTHQYNINLEAINLSEIINPKEDDIAIFFINDLENIINNNKNSIKVLSMDEGNKLQIYFLVFKLLEHLFPHIDIAKHTLRFKKMLDTLENPFEVSSTKLKQNHTLDVLNLSKKHPKNNQNTEALSLSIRGRLNEILKSFQDKLSMKLIGITSVIFLISILIFQTHQKLYSNAENNNTAIENDKTWNVPRQDITFIGRKKLLEELSQKLQYPVNKQTPNPLLVCVCSGLGGIGKTQLSLYFLRNTQHPYTLKAWFPAEDNHLLEQKYLEFAKTLGYVESSQKNNLNSAILYVKKWLSLHPGWLLVFDNANNYSELEPFLPESGGHIIITSRQRHWPSNFKSLEMDLVSEAEGLEIIKSLTKNNLHAEEKESKELVKLLGFLPLALVQASAYIHHNQISIAEYLNLYRNHEIEMLSDKTLPEGVHIHPVAITWNISLKAILKEAKNNHEPPIAMELLMVCAHLAPDKISRDLLLAWLQFAHPNLTTPKLILNKHVALLWKYSMIKYDADNVSTHRLVQTVLRHQLQNSLNLEHPLYPNLNMAWYTSLLRFFINHESEFKLTNSLKQFLEIRDQFKRKFNNQYNDNIAHLDLITAPILYNQEKYEEYLNVLNEVNHYLKTRKGLDFLKCKILYLYSAYFRKKEDYVQAEEKLNQAILALNTIEKNHSSLHTLKYEDFEYLKAKIFYNVASLSFAKNQKLKYTERDQKIIEKAILGIKESILIFTKYHHTRDWLRSIELCGRLTVLTNRGDDVINTFNQYIPLVEKIADDRTKMLFYLTYAEAYAVEKNIVKALQYSDKAKLQAEKMSLLGELIKIEKRQEILKSQREA